MERDNRAQQALLKNLANISENQVCFECAARNPQWTSVNNGVFLCMNCCGSHRRSLGVEVSRIRSIALDAWSAESIALMTVGGNAKAKRFLTSLGINPPYTNDIYSNTHMADYRIVLKLQAEYYLHHKDADKEPRKSNDEFPTLFDLAVRACCKYDGSSLNEQIETRQAEFLRPKIVSYLTDQNQLYGDKISLVRGNNITSLELDGRKLKSKDIATIAKNCPELQSFRMELFYDKDNGLSEGLSSLLSYCSKLMTLKMEFSVVDLDAKKFNDSMMPFSVKLKEMTLFKCEYKNTEITFPAIEDILSLCSKLECLTLSKKNSDRDYQDTTYRYPFIKLLTADIVKLV